MATTTVPRSSVLPDYSPAPPVPSYSPEPADDEERVEHTPGAHAVPTGVYTKESGGDALWLNAQDPSAEFPTYGRHASIIGFVTLQDRETVSEIILKVRGKMEARFSQGGSRTTCLVHKNYTIWSSDQSHCSICPSAVPFSFTLASEFQDYAALADSRTTPVSGISYALPPSYEIPFIKDSGLFKSSYSLSATITRTMSHKVRFLTKSNTISVPFNYRPRTRPWRPIQRSMNFLSDIKIMPEEFRQVSGKLHPRANSTAHPMDLHLFVPSVEIFGLNDTIPFHVQLTGAVSSLREFLPASSADDGKATLVGMLVRQVIITLNRRSATRTIPIRQAIMSPCPPGPGVTAESSVHEASLDWNGKVRCRSDIVVGTFDAGCVSIKDFIVITLEPLRAETRCEYNTLWLSHQIRLVTESWVEDSSLSRDDPR